MKSEQLLVRNKANKDWILVVALNKLKKKGYNFELRREADCLFCSELQEWIMPENFAVDEYYYFESIMNPDAERMLYAISLPAGLKGFLIDTCNAYADNISPEMANKLKFDTIQHRRKDIANAVKIIIPDKFNEALAF